MTTRSRLATRARSSTSRQRSADDTQQQQADQEQEQMAELRQRRNNRRSQDQSEDGGRQPSPIAEVHDRVFDPRGAVLVGLLRLAREQANAGNISSAVRVYTKVLERHQGTGAAFAAAEELIELAESLQHEGRYYTALKILDRVDQLS